MEILGFLVGRQALHVRHFRHNHCTDGADMGIPAGAAWGPLDAPLPPAPATPPPPEPPLIAESVCVDAAKAKIVKSAKALGRVLVDE
jgi:hypothetical protein